MKLSLLSEGLLRAAAVTGVFGLAASGALAQDESSGGYAIEEITVTAQKRAENLQETPIAITALSEAAIEDRGIKNMKDMFSSVPGLQGYEAPSSRGNLGVSLRGVASGNASNLSIDPANGMYIDGVYLGKASGLGLDSMDLERIEVLRGPQGTLYGRNSTGGAINFITRKPGDEFGLKFQASAGSEGMQEFKGRIDVPFSETFMTSLSAQSRERDHLYGNTSGGEGFENIDRQGFRIAARWQPNDNFTADYSYESNEMDEEIQALDMVSFNPQGAGVLAASGFPTNTTINSRDRYNTVAAIQGGFGQLLQFGLIPTLPQTTQYNQWLLDWLSWADANATGISSRKGHIGSADSGHTSINENDGHSLTLAWTVDDMGAFGDVEFKSITGWREMYNVNQGDLDGQDNTVDSGIIFHGTLQAIGGAYFGQFPGIPAATQFALANSIVDQINARGRAETFNSYQINDYQQFSQELQMVGSTDTVDYAVGFFYFDDEGERRANSLATFPLSATFANNYDNGGTAWSLYSQITWLPSIDSPWEFTGGLRYTEEEKNVTQLHRSNNVIPGGFVGAFFGGIPFSALYTDTPAEALETMPEVPGVYGRSYSKDFDNVSGKFTVAYRFSDNVNGYATYSTGYRSGGFNGERFDASSDQAEQVDEETISSAEVGLKADLWDGRMRLNTAYFAYTYDDKQVSILGEENGIVTSRTSNSGKSEANGLELELTLLPIEDLLLNLNYSWISQDTKEFPPLIAPESAGGAVLETADLVNDGLMPENQISFNADWTIMEGEYGLLMFNVNGVWQEKSYGIGLNAFLFNAIPDAASTVDTPVVMDQISRDERTMINARLALNEIPMGEGSLSVGVWGRNILDDDHVDFSFNFGAGLGLNLAQYGEPQTYGIDFIYRY